MVRFVVVVIGLIRVEMMGVVGSLLGWSLWKSWVGRSLFRWGGELCVGGRGGVGGLGGAIYRKSCRITRSTERMAVF